VRRGNPRPSVSIDQRAQRPFEAQLQFQLPGNPSADLLASFKIWTSPAIETHGLTAGQAFVNLDISIANPLFWPTSWALYGVVVLGLGTAGSPGPPSILGNNPLFGGKASPGPGIYQMNVAGSGWGDRPSVRASHPESMWWELWAWGGSTIPLDVKIDGYLVMGRGY
jgi:hypothetical protein